MAKVSIAPNRMYPTFENYIGPYEMDEAQCPGVIGQGVGATLVRLEDIRIKREIRNGGAQKGEMEAAKRPSPER